MSLYGHTWLDSQALLVTYIEQLDTFLGKHKLTLEKKITEQHQHNFKFLGFRTRKVRATIIFRVFLKASITIFINNFLSCFFFFYTQLFLYSASLLANSNTNLFSWLSKLIDIIISFSTFYCWNEQRGWMEKHKILKIDRKNYFFC